MYSLAAGGADADDGSRDADGDTLLDTYELAQGTNPQLPTATPTASTTPAS
jgi:hypothetical protein